MRRGNLLVSATFQFDLYINECFASQCHHSTKKQFPTFFLFNTAISAIKRKQRRVELDLLLIFLSREMVALLMVKCNLTEAEVLAAEQEFNAANPSGVIAKEKFILSMQVTINVWLTVVKRYKIPLFHI